MKHHALQRLAGVLPGFARSERVRTCIERLPSCGTPLTRHIAQSTVVAASATLTAVAVALAVAGAILLSPHPITVIDGDTVDRWPWRYRLVGFDAPETRKGRYKCRQELERGLAATTRLKQLLAAARRVELVRTQWRLDRWGRVLARIKVDGQDVAQIAIAEGWGVAYNGRGPKRDWCAG